MRTCTELGVCQARECHDCPMLGMRVVDDTAAQWGLSVPVRPVLRSFGDECASEQEARLFDVGGNRAKSRVGWAGRNLGVRAPADGETPLSSAEAVVAMRECLV